MNEQQQHHDLANFARNAQDGTYHVKLGPISALLVIERQEITSLKTLAGRNKKFIINLVSETPIRPLAWEQDERRRSERQAVGQGSQR